MKTTDFLTELSNEKLAQYKTAASADATKADKAGDFKKGDKRFKGINTATKKQFANDAKKVSESKQFVLNESLLMEDPVYRQFKAVGKYIAERRLSKEEIYQIFADAETGMTNKDTGANRTMLGRGKDVTGKAVTSVKDAVSGVLNSIQSSAPVAAVDVAYDQAAEAIGKMTGGEKSKVMQSIIAYRNLAKEYPKTAGFAKAALVAALGLATGGAGLPAIAGLTYALDSAIKGDKLSSVIGKGAGAAALAYGGQALASKANAATTPTGADIPGANPHQLDPSQLQQPPATNIPGANPHQLDPSQFQPSPTDLPPAASDIVKTVAKGDTLSNIAQQNQTSVEVLMRANPQITNPDALAVGTKIHIPATNATTYYHGVGTGSDTAAKTASGAYDSVPKALAKQVAGNSSDVASTAASNAGTNASSQAATSAAQDASTHAATNAASSAAEHSIRIGGQPFIPGEPLSRIQMAAVDMSKSMGNPVSPAVQQAYDMAAKAGVGATKMAGTAGIEAGKKLNFESVNFKKLSAYDLIDKKTTALNWALNESIGNKTRNVNLTTLGVYTIFENVDRCRIAVMEAAATGSEADDPTDAAYAARYGNGPGQRPVFSKAPTAEPTAAPGSNRPEQYRPDQPGGKGKQSKPGLIGRGLNWLDKTAGKVGGALSNFGHQFTTNVTKEKLKMNWTQKGQPSDSDQLAEFMKSQGVPEEVISTVYTKMGLPFTMTPAAATDTGGAGAGAFGNMANQLSGGNNSTASTGGSTSAPANAGGTVNSFTGSVNSYKNAGQSSFQPRANGGSASSTGNTVQQSQQPQQSQQQQTEPNTPREQQAVARTVRQQIDDIMHTIMTQHNDDQPALVKYLRQRLDGSFPPEVAASTTPKATTTKKSASGRKKPDNTVAMPKKSNNMKVAATNESLGLNYPETYEQTNDKFKSKGQRRVAALTNEEEKQRIDPKCWTGYKKQGTKMKGGTRVNNCVPVKESAILSGLHRVDEGWKNALGSAALAGAMALGGAAHGRVLPDQDPGVNRLTGKPNVTQVAQDDEKPAAKASSGYSAEYLQSVIDGTHPRPMISVEKAKQLLQQQGQQ